MKIKLNGIYSILDYRISHKLLLLRRSDRIGEDIVNHDLLFKSVFYLELPTRIENMVLEIGGDDDLKYLITRCGKELESGRLNIYRISNEMYKYFIVASDVNEEENKIPPLESSIQT